MTTTSAPLEPYYIVELPIARKDAQRRGLPRQIGKLLAAFETGGNKQAAESALDFFAELLASLLGATRQLYAQPIGSYRHLDWYRPRLDDGGFRYWFDAQYEAGKRRKPTLLTVECGTAQATRSAFRLFSSEAIVFFEGEPLSFRRTLEPILLAGRSRANYEADYLRAVNEHAFFAFFEDTKLSLELLGIRTEVLRAFSLALKLCPGT